MELLNRRRTPAALTVLVLMLGLVVTACGSSSSSHSTTSSSSASGGSAKSGTSAAASGTPFTVLMVIDTTGPLKVYGSVDQATMQAAARYWNAHGGILGHPVTVKVLDDNGDTSTAVSVATQYLSSHPKPDMIFAGASATDSAGLIPLVKRDGLLDVAVDDGNNECATNAQVTCPDAFIPATGTNNQMVNVVGFMKSKAYKKVGILEEEDAFSESETGPLQAQLKAAGLSSSVATFTPTAVNINPQISELESDGVNVIFVEGLAAAPGYALSGRAQLGLISKIPYVFDAGAAAVDLTKLAPASDLANSYEEIARSSDPKVTMPGRTQLLKSGTPAVSAQPLIVASFPWTDLVLVHDAAAQAGSISTDAIASALQNLRPQYQDDPLFMSAPVIQFSKNDHLDVSPKAANSYLVVPTGPIKNGMVYSTK